MKYLVLAVLLLASTKATALTGNDLLRQHTAEKNRYAIGVLAYLRGVVESEAAYAALYKSNPPTDYGAWATIGMNALTPPPFCMPDSADTGQAYDIVIQAISSAPADRHLPAILLARSALRVAWPCPFGPKKPDDSR